MALGRSLLWVLGVALAAQLAGVERDGGETQSAAALLADARAQGTVEAWTTYVQACPGDAAMTEARTFLDSRLRADLDDPAHLDRYRHRQLLIAAINAGSLPAAARLIELSWWDCGRRVDPARPEIAHWQDSASVIDGLTAEQIHAALCAFHEASAPERKAAELNLHMHAYLDRLRRSPSQNPALLALEAWLVSSYEPRDPLKADQLVQGQIVASANDPALSGNDPLLLDARVTMLTNSVWYQAQPDRVAVNAILSGALQRCRASANLVGQGILLAKLGEMRYYDSSSGDNVSREPREEPVELLAQAAALFEKAGDQGRRGRCLGALANYRFPRQAEADLEPTIKAYEEAIQLCRDAADWEGLGINLRSLAGCYYYRKVPKQGVEWQKAGAIYEDAALAFAKADQIDQQAFCLYWQGVCQNPEKSKEITWKQNMLIHRAAEEAFAQTGDSYYRPWNLCLLGEAQSEIGEVDEARHSFAQALGLVRANPALTNGNPELLRRIAAGLRALRK